MTEVVSARLSEDLLDRLDIARGEASRGAWLTALATRDLTAAARPAGAKLAGGIPCPGVACSHSGCCQRDTARYGDPDDFGGLILCPSHAADAVGERYVRPRPAQRSSVLRAEPEPAV